MSVEKSQIDSIEDRATEFRNVNESLPSTFDGLSQEEHIALEKKRKIPLLAALVHQL